MTEIRFRIVPNVSLKIVPGPILVANPAAGSAPSLAERGNRPLRDVIRPGASGSSLIKRSRSVSAAVRSVMSPMMMQVVKSPSGLLQTTDEISIEKKVPSFGRARSSPGALPERCRAAIRTARRGSEESIKLRLPSYYKISSRVRPGIRPAAGFASSMEPSGAVSIKPSRLF